MGDQRQESGSAARAAALDRAGGNAENAGRLGHRVALHVDQDESGSLIDGKSAQRFEELAVEVVAFSGSGRGLVRFEELFQAFGVIDGRRLPGCGFAGAVQAGVHRDAVQPGRDGGLPAEGVRCPVGGDQGVLDGVGGFLPVSLGAQGHGPEPVTMAAHELAEGVLVTRDMAGEEVLIACFAVGGVIHFRTPSPR
jgi:hypothetical protein